MAQRNPGPIPIHPDPSGSCEYEMVRMAIRGNTMVVVVQCKYHGTTFAVQGPSAARINEQGQYLIDEFDYAEGVEMAAQGFDGLQRKPDRESFDQTYAEHIAKDIPAITERLKADGFPGLRAADGGKKTSRDAAKEAIELRRILGHDETERILAEVGANKLSTTKVTGVLTSDMSRNVINLNIDGNDLGDLPMIAMLDPHAVGGAIGNAMIDAMMASATDGIDATNAVQTLRTAAMMKQLTEGILPTEMEWPEEKN